MYWVGCDMMMTTAWFELEHYVRLIVDETACNQDDNAQAGGAVRAQDEVKLESVVLPAVDQPSRRRRDASAVEPQANKLKTSAKGRGYMV
jgi:hypothetical protein